MGIRIPRKKKKKCLPPKAISILQLLNQRIIQRFIFFYLRPTFEISLQKNLQFECNSSINIEIVFNTKLRWNNKHIP